MNEVKKRGRPPREKVSIVSTGRRGRPKKITEILNEKRTLTIKDLYPNGRPVIRRPEIKKKDAFTPEQKLKFGMTLTKEESQKLSQKLFPKPEEHDPTYEAIEKTRDLIDMQDKDDIGDVRIVLSAEDKQELAAKIEKDVKEREQIREQADKRIKEHGQINLAQSALRASLNAKKKAPHKLVTPEKHGLTEGTRQVGRPKGVRNKASVAIEQMGEENAMLCMEQMVRWMKAGDKDATRFLLERVYKGRKGHVRYIGYEGEVDTIEEINRASSMIVKMALAGEISPEEADDHMKLLEKKMKMIIDTEYASRFEATCQKVDSIKRGE